MKPHYYIMTHKKILRLEGDMTFDALPVAIRERVLEADDIVSLDQDQANWRVVIFRDEILDLEEFTEWLATPEAMMSEELELDLIAN